MRVTHTANSLVEFRPMVKEQIAYQTDGWTNGQTDDTEVITISPLLFFFKTCFFLVCFIALRPKSTAMVMAANQYFVHILSL